MRIAQPDVWYSSWRGIKSGSTDPANSVAASRLTLKLTDVRVVWIYVGHITTKHELAFIFIQKLQISSMT